MWASWEKWKTNSWQSCRNRSRVDRLVVTDRRGRPSARPSAGGFRVDGDRLDPVNEVLQLQVLPRRLRHVERGPGSVGLAPTLRNSDPAEPGHAPPPRPTRQSTPDTPPGPAVVVRPILNSQIVRRRRDDDVDAACRQAARAARPSRRDRSEGREAAREKSVGLGKTQGARRIVPGTRRCTKRQATAVAALGVTPCSGRVTACRAHVRDTV